MIQQIVKVTTPNKMLFIKGKLSRTPLEVIVKFENELNLLKSSMIHQGIDFTIEEYVPLKTIKKVQIKNVTAKKKEIIKKVKKPKTLLEKISTETDE